MAEFQEIKAQPVPVEAKSLAAFRQQSIGESNRGGRATTADEDAIYSASRGFHLGEIGGTEAKVPTDAEKAAGLVKALNGLAVKDKTGQVTETIQVSEADIAKVHQTIQTLIQQGKLVGLDMVCDGMGWHGSGDIASSIITYIATREIGQMVQSGGDVTIDGLKKAMLKANDVMAAYNDKNSAEAGATLVAQVTNKDGQTFVVSVGDARAYKIDAQGNVMRITQDQSAVEAKLAASKLKPSGVFSAPERNFIIRSFGAGGKFLAEDVRVYYGQLATGEKLVLCCDGVWEGIDAGNPQVQAAMQAVDAQYEADLQAGRSIQEAADRAFGEIFKLNLAGLAPNATPDQLIKHLVRPEAGTNSGDNVSAVVVTQEPVAQAPRPVVEAPVTPPVPPEIIAFPKGTQVRVQRSDGSIEAGWTVMRFDPQTGDATVVKVVGEDTTIKLVPRDELIRLNRVQEQATVAAAGSFADLFKALDTHNSWPAGDGQPYTIDDLKHLINEVRSGKRPLDYITREGGLRQKVSELLAKEKGSS